MEHIGIDVHKRESQICVLTEEGEISERRIQSTRAKFTAVFQARARARVLLEATTESEWVAQTIEHCGHEVIVADPNYAPMYPERRRRVKTDRRDARMWAEAARLVSPRASGLGRAAGGAAAAPGARPAGTSPWAHPLTDARAGAQRGAARPTRTPWLVEGAARAHWRCVSERRRFFTNTEVT